MPDLSGKFKNPFRVEAKVIPNASSETLKAVDCYVSSIDICNETAGALTVTITDNQGTPVEFLKDASIAAKATVSINFNNLRKFKGGIIWQASAAGLNGQLEGFCAPV